MRVLLYSDDKGQFLAPELLYGLKEKLRKNVSVYKPKMAGAGGNGSGGIQETMDDFDAIIIHYTAFKDKDFEYVLNRKTSTTKIFLDHFDDFFVRRIYWHPEISYYLKRELYRNAPSTAYSIQWWARYTYELLFEMRQSRDRTLLSKWNMPAGIAVRGSYRKLKPYQLTVVPECTRTPRKRVYDVSFLGHLTSPDRARYIRALGRISTELGINCLLKASRGGPNPVGKEEYVRTLLSSKAGLSMKGVGYDSVRYWEIPCYGSMLLSQRLPIQIPNDFVEGESALYFDRDDELKRKIERYIIKSEEWKEIARNGQRHFFRNHTPAKRAESVLRLVRRR